MPVREITTFELSCDRCDYVAEMEEGEISLFESAAKAAGYARDSGWKVVQADQGLYWFSCTGCEAY